MNMPGTALPEEAPNREDSGPNLLDLLAMLVARRWLLVAAPLAVGLATLGATFLIKPTFTARTSFIPPQQQQQGGAASALASLGSLAGLVGGSVGIKTPGDQYVSFLQSTTVEDHIVDRFDLMKEYQVKYRFEARKTLEGNTHITLGKKDGLITIEADAHDPAMAAGIANEYIVALRDLTSKLQLTEAQQRRSFYQGQLEQTSKQLAAAQTALQNSGFNPGAIKAEPKAAADAYARLQAALTDGEVKLQALRHNLADSAPEVQQQLAILSGLREQMSKIEEQAQLSPSQGNADYIGKYREYKYQETLFELFSKQFEIAKLDESRDDALVQIVDPATPPEHKSRPKRAVAAVMATVLSEVLLLVGLGALAAWRRAASEPSNAEGMARLRAAWRGTR